ncbi:MAG: SH3 domain-containing protein [Geminicoccaceae bacterium]
MSASGVFGRSCHLPVLGLIAFALPWIGMAELGWAQQAATPSPTAATLADWDGKSAVTLDELRLHALEIGDLLDRASARVDRLADEASDQTESGALLGAIRHELDLSRQWNRHLTSILLEVAEARRALGVRERKAAAEIFELTSIAEEARLELIALWESLRPGMPTPFGEHDLLGPKPETSRPSAPGHGKSGIDMKAAETLEAPDQAASEANRVLDEINAIEEIAAGDIEAVRAKIMDALRTLAPHRKGPINSDVLEDGRVDGGLSSKEITAWAASIASKLHHEGLEDVEQAGDHAESIQSLPEVETMVIESEILATTAVRIAPDRRAHPIATVKAGSLVLVTGKVIDRDWYRVKTDSGRFGYISGELIRHQALPSKTERRIKSS